jgi:hypothetical protein
MQIIKIFFILFITLSFFPAFPQDGLSKEIALYNFEHDPQGWEIPDWALAKKDHVAETIGISEFQAADGKCALEVGVDFPGGPGWKGAYVERVVDVNDWSIFNYISVAIFLPKDAPRGLRARMILSVGEEWKWTEMNKAFPLIPGEWVTIKALLTAESMDWRRFITDAFRTDIKKIGIRIESNGNIAYKGPVYIDSVKLSE